MIGQTISHYRIIPWTVEYGNMLGVAMSLFVINFSNIVIDVTFLAKNSDPSAPAVKVDWRFRSHPPQLSPCRHDDFSFLRSFIAASSLRRL